MFEWLRRKRMHSRWNTLVSTVTSSIALKNKDPIEFRRILAERTREYIKTLSKEERESLQIILTVNGVECFTLEQLPELIMKDDNIYEAWLTVIRNANQGSV